jgi:hypothetical protein
MHAQLAIKQAKLALSYAGHAFVHRGEEMVKPKVMCESMELAR